MNSKNQASKAQNQHGQQNQEPKKGQDPKDASNPKATKELHKKEHTGSKKGSGPQ